MTELADTVALRSSGVAEPRPTLGSILEGADARRNAFDTIRLLAAMSVIVSHSFLVTSGSNAIEPLYRLTAGQTSIGGLAVGVFFTISGMFIAASFDRSASAWEFVRKRALRIMPALVVVIALSALVLGPLKTALPLGEYFGARATWAYFANAAFLPNSQMLPGVFAGHTVPFVNGSIWTLKFEVMCYAFTAFVMMTGRFKSPLVLAAWVMSFVISLLFPAAEQATGAMYYVVMSAKLFRFFGAGAAMYLYRHKVPIHSGLAAAGLVLTVLATVTPWFLETAALFGSYAVIVFGYRAPAWFRQLTERGDISYGVYVYGWPIQQLVWPIGESQPMHWAINTAIALPLAMLAGLASWLLVEKPALRFKGLPKGLQRPAPARTA